MRTRWIVLALLLLSPPPMAPASAGGPYRVVLRDGSWVQAEEPPVLADGRALVRLHPSGLLTSLPQARVDLPATELANRPGGAVVGAPAETERFRGAFTWGGDSTLPPPLPLPPPPAGTPTAEEQVRLSEEYSRALAEMLRWQRDLEEELESLRDEADRVDRYLRLSFSDLRLRRALAYQLGDLDEEIEATDAALDRVRRQIRDLHLEAADRGIHLRQLPYPLLD